MPVRLVRRAGAAIGIEKCRKIQTAPRGVVGISPKSFSMSSLSQFGGVRLSEKFDRMASPNAG